MFAKARTVFLRKTFTLLIWLRLDFLVAILLVIASKAYFSNGKKNAPKVLHFIPKTAFIDDLEAIFGRNDNSIQLRSFNREFLLALTSPYFSKGRNEYNFINVETAEDDRSIQKRLSNILQYFTMMTNTSGFITCAYNYCEQRDLAKIARKMGLSFIALHKECITTPYTRAARNLIYKTQVGQFWGSLLLTYNEDERRSITQAGGNYKAIAIGCPRADNYFTSGDYGSPTNSNNQENLDIDLLFFPFSPFGYLPIYRKRRVSPAGFEHIEGIETVEFSKLLRSSVEWVIDFAKSNRHMKIVVKTKVGFSLAQILPEEIGTISELENVTIVETGTANSLIKRSKSIFGFNSTVLIEGLAANKNVICPFDKSWSEDLRSQVTLQLDNAVSYVSSSTQLSKSVHKMNKNKQCGDVERARKQVMIKYLGRASAGASELALREIKNEVGI